MIYAVHSADESSRATCADATVRRWAELVELISSHGRLLRRSFGELLARRGLPDSQFSILWACLNAPVPGLAQTELAAELGLSPAHVSGQVDQLRDRGLLVCERSVQDRRRQVWRLSDAGRDYVRQLLSEMQQGWHISPELIHDPLWPDVLRLVSALSVASSEASCGLSLAQPNPMENPSSCIQPSCTAEHADSTLAAVHAEKGATS